MFAVRGCLPINFEGAYVSHGNTLSWMSNNTKKMRPPPMSATAVAAPASAPFPTTTADSFPALSSKAVATNQIPQTAKFSYASAAATLSATAAAAAASASAAGPSLPIKGMKSAAEKGAGSEEIECWTLTSTREFGSANKVRSTIVW